MEEHSAVISKEHLQGRHKIPFGVKDGMMVHVRDVPNGKSCGCFCAACGDALIAANNGLKRVAHFRHNSGAECAGGYETAIHRAAKEVLLSCRSVTLPDYSEEVSVEASNHHKIRDIVGFESVTVTADHAESEVTVEDFRPDVMFVIGGRKLFIEIRVTHAVDEVKEAKIRRHGTSTIEIHLNGLEPAQLIDRAAFEQAVCSDLSNREWVFSERAERRRKHVLAALEIKRADYEAQLEKKNKKRKEVARKAQEKQASLEQHKAQKRAEIEPELKLLNDSTGIDWIHAKRAELSQKQTYHSKALQNLNGTSALFCKLRADWIFDVHHESWQSFVLDFLFSPPEGQRRFSAHQVKQAVAKRFGVIHFVKVLNDIKQKHKAQGRERDKAYGSYGSYLFSVEENKAIPSPFYVVKDYLDHLALVGLLRWIPWQDDSDLYQVQASSVSIALHRIREAEERAQRIEERAVEARSPIYNATVGLLPHVLGTFRETYQERMEALRASEMYIYENHQGAGRKCTHCFFINLPDASVCSFCNKDRLALFTTSYERILTLKARLRSSHEPVRSLSAMSQFEPHHLVEMLDRLKTEDNSSDS